MGIFRFLLRKLINKFQHNIELSPVDEILLSIYMENIKWETVNLAELSIHVHQIVNLRLMNLLNILRLRRCFMHLTLLYFNTTYQKQSQFKPTGEVRYQDAQLRPISHVCYGVKITLPNQRSLHRKIEIQALTSLYILTAVYILAIGSVDFAKAKGA